MGILRFYIDKTLRIEAGGNTKEVVYDQILYQRLVPYSCLAAELVEKFTVLPHEAFLSTGAPNPEYNKKISQAELAKR